MQSKPFDELIGQLGRLESDDKPARDKSGEQLPARIPKCPTCGRVLCMCPKVPK